MRTRLLKPAFFKNEELAELDPIVRLLFAGLWCIADADGLIEDRPKRIKAELFPYDDFDVGDSLLKLQTAKFIIRKSNNEGFAWIEILNFRKHQKPHAREPAIVSAAMSPEKTGQVPAGPEKTRRAAAKSPLTLNPSPLTLNPSAPSPGASRPTASEIVQWWNQFDDSIASSVQEPPSEAVCASVRRFDAEDDVRLPFDDLTALAHQIRQSAYLHGKPWFRLLWLFGKDKETGENNAAKVLSGRYIDKAKKKKSGELTEKEKLERRVKRTKEAIKKGDLEDRRTNDQVCFGQPVQVCDAEEWERVKDESSD